MSTPDRYKPDKAVYEDEDWLRKQYWENELSIEEVAAKTDVSTQTVRREMHERGVDVRDPPWESPEKWDYSGGEGAEYYVGQRGVNNVGGDDDGGDDHTVVEWRNRDSIGPK